MKIGILGTGGVGKAFAKKLSGLGHQVMLGTRNTENTLGKSENGIAEMIKNSQAIKLGTFAEAAAFGEMVINVAKGAVTMEVINSIGTKALENKVLIDVSNPLDFSKGMPPSLIPGLCNTNSLGEEIQRKLPATKVVKTLNTMWNGLMLDPGLLKGEHINYLCGNDQEAKKKVRSLLSEFGWKDAQLMDLGDITAARATEATLPIWLRVYGIKQSGAFNFNIVSQ